MDGGGGVRNTKPSVMVGGDHKNDPSPRIVALGEPFGIAPPLDRLDAEFPERLLRAIADEYALYLYDVPSLEGSDAYGFVLSREPLDERELQQIEAWHWQEPFDGVYDSTR